MTNFHIFNHSCEHMPEIADGSINLIIMDPPFNIGKKYADESDDRSDEGYKKEMGSVFAEAKRVLNNKGLVVALVPEKVMIQGKTIDYVPLYIDIAQQTGLLLVKRFSYRITEDEPDCIPKNDFDNVDKSHNYHSEEIQGLVFAKQKLDITPHMSAIYHYTPREGHPCPYPFELMSDLMHNFFEKGYCVLDPFMGVGDLGVNVVQEGGVFFGYEITKKFFDIAKKKLDMTTKL